MNTTLQNQSVPEVKSPVVSLSDVTKIYGRGDTRVRALKGIDLVINKGEFTSIMENQPCFTLLPVSIIQRRVW